MSKASNIRILLADDHTLVRKGMAALLANEVNFEVVGEADSGHEAISLAKELCPDIILMDISMPRLNGIQAIRRISKTAQRCRILVLSMHHNKDYISQALCAGAVGYLVKDSAPFVLKEAIEQVYQGKCYLSPEISKLVIDGYTESVERLDKMTEQPQIKLTSRECEILQLIVEGRSSKEVASFLMISVKTVENHRKNIMQKLNIHNLAGLVQYAIRKGILAVETPE